MPKGGGKGKRNQTADQLYSKRGKNDKNPNPHNPEGWNLAIKAGVDEFHCGSRIKMAAMLDMEAVKFAKFHCLICGDKFLSEKDHKLHNDRFHQENHLSICEICKHPVDLLEEHKIKYHHNLACMLPKVEESESNN